jgi:hypothetical protein
MVIFDKLRKMPLSTLFQLYRGGQFYWGSTQRKPLTCNSKAYSISEKYNVPDEIA